MNSTYIFCTVHSKNQEQLAFFHAFQRQRALLTGVKRAISVVKNLIFTTSVICDKKE